MRTYFPFMHTSIVPYVYRPAGKHTHEHHISPRPLSYPPIRPLRSDPSDPTPPQPPVLTIASTPAFFLHVQAFPGRLLTDVDVAAFLSASQSCDTDT